MSKFTDKLSSGKFLSAVLVIGTYCWVINCCALAVSLGRMRSDTFLALFVGFSGLAGMIITFYFTKNKESVQ